MIQADSPVILAIDDEPLNFTIVEELLGENIRQIQH